MDYGLPKVSGTWVQLSTICSHRMLTSTIGSLTLLYECEIWCLRGDLFNRPRSFYKSCVYSMCRASLYHAFHHHNSSATLFQRLNGMDLDSYYHNRIIRWAGHVARMPMTRAPRQLLTGWIAHSRLNGCPEVKWGRTLKKALKCEELQVNVKEGRNGDGVPKQMIAQNGDRVRTRSLCRLDPEGLMRVNINTLFFKRTLKPVRILLEDSSIGIFFSIRST